METGNEQEFYVSLVIYGTVLTLGFCLLIAFGFLFVAIRNKVKRKKVIKQIYEQERKNGTTGGSKFP